MNSFNDKTKTNNNYINQQIVIDDIYDNVTNNKIFIDLPVSLYEQDNTIVEVEKNIEDTDYIINLIDSFKSNNFKHKKYNNSTTIESSKTHSSIDNKIKNSFLYHLSIFLKIDISNIINNIQKHINEQDFDSLKNITSSYKKSIQAIKTFLIENNTDDNLNDSVLYYISYLYKISVLFVSNNICKYYNYFDKIQENNNYDVLVFNVLSKNYFEINEIIKITDFNSYINSKNLFEFKSNSELNKLKISEIKLLYNNINNTFKNKNLDSNLNKIGLILYLNKFFENYNK